MRRTLPAAVESRKSYCLLCRQPGRRPAHEETTHGRHRRRAQARLRRPAQALHLHRGARPLRESIRSFAVKELAPHAEEWEETTFPDSVFARMGELGFLGLDKPEEYGGQGGDYYSSLVLAEEIVARPVRRPGDGRRGADRHGDAADPRVRHRGAEARVGGAGDRGREDPLPGHHRARRRLRRGRHQDPRRARRRRVRHQRLEDLHHQRPPRRRDRARDQDRPGRRLRRLHALPRADGRARA